MGFLYGLFLVGNLYFFSYFLVQGLIKGRSISVFLVLLKYLIYVLLLLFGFRHFPAWTILSGFTGGIYVSLLVCVLIYQKQA